MQLTKWIGYSLSICLGLASALPSQATVNWSDCRTETLVTSLPAGITSDALDLQQAVTDANKAFVLVTTSGTSLVQAGSDHLVTAYINSAGQVQVDRDTAVSDVELALTVVECSNDEFSVKSGTVQLLAGQTTNTAAISSVDTDRSLVIVSGRTQDTTANESNGLMRGSFLSDVQIEIERATGATTNTSQAVYQVVTFSEESGVTVQTNSADVILSTGDITEDSVLSNVIDLERAWVYCSWDAQNSGLRQNSIGCQLENDETVRVYRYSGGTNLYTNYVQYFVVEFPPNTITVDRGSFTIEPSGTDDTLYTSYINTTNIGDTQKAFAYITNTVSGTTTNYPRNRWLSYLNSAMSIELDFWRPSSSTGDSTEQYWQIIRFPHYEATGFGQISNSDSSTSGGSPGLISFNCDNFTYGYYTTFCDDVSRYDYAVQLDSGDCGSDCDVTGTAWVGAYSVNPSETPYEIGIIDFDPAITVGSAPDLLGDDTTTTENEAQDASWNEETGELYGWARFTTLADYEDTIFGTVADDWGWLKLRGEIQDGTCTSGVDCSEYGVLFDTETQLFSGWAWNDNGTDHTGNTIEGSGFGWAKFDLSETTGGLTNPWLRTLQGDVFVNADIDTTVPPISTLTTDLEYNATYLIQANGTITDFTSQYASSNPEFAEEPNVDPINFPSDNTSQVYRGDIGDIHLSELIDQATADGNAYGTATVPVDCDETIFTGKTNPLAGQVFYCSGDLTIDRSLTFNNGIGLELGSGTVVVGGNLHIADNITYFGSGYNYIDHINNVASVAWIVEGSVEITPSVNTLVGAFIVLGDAGAAADFSTGTGGDQLTISGLVMARSFNFERDHTGTELVPEPSEDIIYDGRMSANSPPGLEDFSKILPN